MTTRREKKTELHDAKRLVHKLKSSYPKDVEARKLTLNSKLPFKAASIKELLYYRLTELSDVAVTLFEQDKFTSAMVITRSALETLAIFFIYTRKSIML